MSGAAPGRQRERPANSDDEGLIGRCLQGDPQAWSALIDKYKNLIYSIPVRLGMHQDAADIFQSVCVDLLAELPRLRQQRALPKWLMQTCYHTCLRYQRASERLVELAPEGRDGEAGLPAGGDDDLPEQLLIELQQEQILRATVSELPDKCEQMVRLLFFEIPPRPYQDIADELGMATGSIGAIRARCLAHLRKQLEKKGF